jgi:ATPase subunit of ABC transporter with duplicated ATPase domains
MTVQAMEALSIAQGRRLDAAEWRRQVAALPTPEGRRRLIAALHDPDGPHACVLLHRFLQTPRGMGLDSARRIVTAAHLNAACVLAPVRDLSPGERARLVRALERLPR